jgi:hypothetical protein
VLHESYGRRFFLILASFDVLIVGVEGYFHLITPCDTHTYRTPMGEVSACRKDVCVRTHNSRKRQTSTPPAGFEPIMPASERQQIHALDRAATGIGR